MKILTIEKIIEKMSEINTENMNCDAFLGCIIDNAKDIDTVTDTPLQENRIVSNSERDLINDATLRILFGIINFLKLQEITDKRINETILRLTEGINFLKLINETGKTCYEKIDKIN